LPRPFLLAHRPPSSPRKRSLIADLLRIATTKSGDQPDDACNSKFTPTPWPYLHATPAGVRRVEGCSRYLTWHWCGRTELVRGGLVRPFTVCVLSDTQRGERRFGHYSMPTQSDARKIETGACRFTDARNVGATPARPRAIWRCPSPAESQCFSISRGPELKDSIAGNLAHAAASV